MKSHNVFDAETVQLLLMLEQLGVIKMMMAPHGMNPVTNEVEFIEVMFYER